jgi:hypothetical protein
MKTNVVIKETLKADPMQLIICSGNQHFSYNAVIIDFNRSPIFAKDEMDSFRLSLSFYYKHFLSCAKTCMIKWMIHHI